MSESIIAALYDSCASSIEEIVMAILYFKIFNIPFIILWIVFLGVFCTISLRFVNFRLFSHALDILVGKSSSQPGSHGAISHLQAFFTSVSGTIGLGTIAGVAIAISIGGPGAIFWMVVTGLLGMSIKFSEVVLGFKYRTSIAGQVGGGPFRYVKHAFSQAGWHKTGSCIAGFYAVMLLIAMLLGGLTFQSNQAVITFANMFHFVSRSWFSGTLCIVVGLVVIGGIKRVASVTSFVMPFMSISYIAGCLLILLINAEHLGSAIITIWDGILSTDSATGGIIGCFIAGIRRSVFANEAGIGTAAIAHAATKDDEPVRAGCSAMLEPCVDTIIISCLTGLMIIVAGDYHNVTTGDVLLAGSAFLQLSPIFGYVLFPAIVLSFAFSTMISYSYYCEVAWQHLFGRNASIYFCRTLMLLSIYFSGVSQNVSLIARLGDLLFMALSIPNALAIYLLMKTVQAELNAYSVKYLQKNDMLT